TIFDGVDTLDKKTALYSVAEKYKAAVYLKAAERYYAQAMPELTGAALTRQITQDFARDMLPLDHCSRVFASDNQGIKILTQYLDWNILNTRQQGRNLVGAQAGGKYMDIGRGG